MFWVTEIWRQSAVRLAVTLSALFVVTLLASGIFLIRYIERDVRAAVDEELTTRHQEMRGLLATTQQVIKFVATEDEFAFFDLAYQAPDGTIYGSTRRSIFEYSGLLTLRTQELFATPQLEHLEDGGGDDEDDMLLDGDRWRVFVAPLAGGQMVYFEPMDGIETALDIVPPIVLAVGAPILLVTLMAGLVLGRRQQRRLDAIRADMQELAQGHFSRLSAPALPRDDLDDVMVSIGAAADQLEGSFNQMRRFSQNLAHELRTPLARLRATIEGLPGSAPVDRALEQTDEVIRVFEAVQRIARLARGAGDAAFAEVPLRDVAALMQDLYEEICAEAGRDFTVTLSEPATIRGDFQLVAQMVSNLIENALSHAGDGAHIRLIVNGARLSVSDTGKGVPEEAVERMFQPFERIDPNSGSTGLGLALVGAIADYHGAEVAGQTDPGAGFRVTVQFSDLV